MTSAFEEIGQFIQQETRGDACVVSVNAETIEEHIGFALQRRLFQVGQTHKKILVLLSHVQTLDLSGVLQLFFGVAHAERHGGQVQLVGVRENVLSRLKETHLETSFHYATEPEKN